MTLAEDLDRRSNLLLSPTSRKCSMDCIKLWIKKYNELKTFKWQMSIEELEHPADEREKKKLDSMGINIKILGGNNLHVYKEVHDNKTGKRLTWAELIERAKGRK